MEKPNETVPRPGGLVGEQEEFFRPQNIRPTLDVRPTPILSETNHNIERGDMFERNVVPQGNVVGLKVRRTMI